MTKHFLQSVNSGDIERFIGHMQRITEVVSRILSLLVFFCCWYSLKCTHVYTSVNITTCNNPECRRLNVKQVSITGIQQQLIVLIGITCTSGGLLVGECYITSAWNYGFSNPLHYNTRVVILCVKTRFSLHP